MRCPLLAYFQNSYPPDAAKNLQNHGKCRLLEREIMTIKHISKKLITFKRQDTKQKCQTTQNTDNSQNGNKLQLDVTVTTSRLPIDRWQLINVSQNAYLWKYYI